MIISIFTDKNSWMNKFLPELVSKLSAMKHEVNIYEKARSDISGDVAFFLSYFHIVDQDLLNKHKNNIVLHASDLPKGRGWSPLTWQIIEGKNNIKLTLFEAENSVDSGDIYMQKEMVFVGHELIEELRDVLAKTTCEMCCDFIEKYPAILNGAKRQGQDASFYARRNAKDSELSVDKTIGEQFNLLRVVDNEQYPAWFELNGVKYKITIDKF